jgi:tRNA(Ile)-lysidine synthase
LRVLRPLTTFRRAEITRLARHWRLEWLDDPTNLDPRHRRNALRLRGLPYLSRWAGRDVVPILARTADILETEEEYWQSILPATWPAELPLRTLRSQHPAWQRRALMAWLASRGVTDPTFEQIEAIRAMLHQPSPARINLSRSRFCRRRAGCFFIE